MDPGQSNAKPSIRATDATMVKFRQLWYAVMGRLGGERITQDRLVASLVELGLADIDRLVEMIGRVPGQPGPEVEGTGAAQ
jgi:hypothetical protein